MKRAVAVGPHKAATPTAVRRILDEISTQELEPLAVEGIQEFRRRLQRVEELYEALEPAVESPSAAAARFQLRQDHRMAMLNLHAQHLLVSLVVAALGYVPDVDGSTSANNTPS